jgi:hypothetical protein
VRTLPDFQPKTGGAVKSRSVPPPSSVPKVDPGVKTFRTMPKTLPDGLRDARGIKTVPPGTTPGSGKPPVSGVYPRKSPVRVSDFPKAMPDDGSNIRRFSTMPKFTDRYKAGHLDRMTAGAVARDVKLADQYRMYDKGDVARRLKLIQTPTPVPMPLSQRHPPGQRPDGLVAGDRHDGPHHPSKPAWHHAHRGPVSPLYMKDCFSHRYHGPWYLAGACWYPHWNPWVSWSWGYRCHPLFDPRPVWCRPVFYDPCPRWIWWQVPVWTPLPVVVCGTWVDVDPVLVGPRFDLQMLAVRFVDPGHPEEKLGPRYRVWFRNNSTEPIAQPFNVALLASSGGNLAADVPQAGVRVQAIEAGDTQSVDVRLPMEVYQMGRDANGSPAAFTTLHVLIDANREVAEVSENNNGSAIATQEILPVDPAAFGVDPREVRAGDEVQLAGEGFGPEPGRVLIHAGGIEMEGEIRGWYDLGVKVAVPKLPLAGAAQAELVVIRGDGAASNPIPITIQPPDQAPRMVVPPAGR